MAEEDGSGYFFFQSPWKNIFLWNFMDVEREAFLAAPVMDLDILRKLQSILIARAEKKLHIRLLLRFREDDFMLRDVDPETLRILGLLLDEPDSKIEIRFLPNLSLTCLVIDHRKAILATGDLCIKGLQEEIVYGQLLTGSDIVSHLEEDLEKVWESSKVFSQKEINSYMERIKEKLLLRSAHFFQIEAKGVKFNDLDHISLGENVAPQGKDRNEPHLDESRKIIKELLIRARDAVEMDKKSAARFYLEEGLALDPDNPELLLEKGKILTIDKEYEKALACFDKVLDQDEENRDAWAYCGMCHHEMNHLEDALHAYDQATDIDPQHYPVWIKKGTILGKMKGREKDGIKCLEFALSQDPYNEEAWFNKAAILEQRLDLMDEAVLSYRSLLRINPKHVKGLFRMGLLSYKRLNNIEKAKQYFSRVLEAEPSHIQSYLFMSEISENIDKDVNGAYTFLDKAHEANPQSIEIVRREIELLLKHKKKFQRAVELSNDLLSMAPKDPLGLYVSALGALKIDNDAQKAISVMNESIKADPDFKMAIISKANILAEHLNKSQDSISLLKAAIKKRPDDPDLHLELGIIYFDFLYDPKEAMNCFDAVIKLDGGSSIGWYNKGLVLSRGLEKHQEGLKCLDEATTIDDANQQAWFEKGRILQKVYNMTDDAIKCFQKALSFEPEDPEMLTTLANAYKAKSDHKSAVKYFQRAIEASQDGMDAYLGLADMYLQMGSYENVHKTLTGALQNDPRNEKIWMAKADAFRAQNELGKAIECYKRVLLANPENQEAASKKNAAEAQLEKAVKKD